MKAIILSLLCVVVSHVCAAIEGYEGFIAGTLVKTPAGYEKIEALTIGSRVSCLDSTGTLVSSEIIGVKQRLFPCYLELVVDGATIGSGHDQKFLVPLASHFNLASNNAIEEGSVGVHHDDAIHDAHAGVSDTQALIPVFRQLKKSGIVESVRVIEQPVILYDILLKEHHNFLVTERDICAHNYLECVVTICEWGAACCKWVSLKETLYSIGSAIASGLASLFMYQVYTSLAQQNYANNYRYTSSAAIESNADSYTYARSKKKANKGKQHADKSERGENNKGGGEKEEDCWKQPPSWDEEGQHKKHDVANSHKTQGQNSAAQLRYNNTGTYHHQNNTGSKSRAPRDGQRALENSIPNQDSCRSEKRFGVSNGEVVEFQYTRQGEYHGYVIEFSNLSPKNQAALRAAGLVKGKRGDPIV